MDEHIVARVREIIVRHEGSRIGRNGWPILRDQLALWEFLHLRKGDLGQLRARRDRYRQELSGRPASSRYRWLKAMIDGIGLFGSSQEIWIAEFGDPFHPQGILPHRPREGRQYIVDPELSLVLVLTTEVDLPVAASFKTDLDPAEREALASLEPRLRKLAIEAIRTAPHLTVIEQEGRWPALLYEELILDDPCITIASREAIDYRVHESETVSVDDAPILPGSFHRLLDAGVVHEVTYGDAEMGPQFTVWLAPEIRFSFVDPSVTMGAVLLVDEDLRRVGAEPRCDLATFERIQAEAAVRLDQDQERDLLRGDPALAPVVSALRSTGIECDRCRQPIRRVLSLQIRDGAPMLGCERCLALRVVKVSGTSFSLRLPERCDLCGRGTEGALGASNKCPVCSRDADWWSEPEE